MQHRGGPVSLHIPVTSLVLMQKSHKECFMEILLHLFTMKKWWNSNKKEVNEKAAKEIEDLTLFIFHASRGQLLLISWSTLMNKAVWIKLEQFKKNSRYKGAIILKKFQWEWLNYKDYFYLQWWFSEMQRKICYSKLRSM